MGAVAVMSIHGPFRSLLYILAVNAFIFAALEYTSSIILTRFGLGKGTTRIFNAANERDNNFVVQYDERLGYHIVHNNVDPDHFSDSAGTIFSKNKRKGVYRILCLGGSTTYGVGADRSNAYPAQLGDILRRMYGKCGLEFEVFNLGVMGYHSWHSRIRYAVELEALNPDLIILMDAVNDLVSSTIADNSMSYVQEKDRLLGLTNALAGSSFLQKTDSYLSSHLNTYMLTKSLASVVIGKVSSKNDPENDTDMKRLMESFGYKENMDYIIATAAKDGTDVALVNYPWLGAHNIPTGAPKSLLDASTPLYLFGKNWFAMTNSEIGRQSGIVVIDPQPEFSSMTSSDVRNIDALYHDEIHFTKLGNQLLARQIAEALLAVPSFGKMTRGCIPSSMPNAVKWDDPRIHFTNGWPRPIETALAFSRKGMHDIELNASEVQGWVSASPSISALSGSIVLEASSDFSPVPMRFTRYPAFWFPRVSCPGDRVEVVFQNQSVFRLDGADDCRFTGLSDRFGLDLPAMKAGERLEVRLHGRAQVWMKDGSLFWNGDQTHPGY
jgi:lysophospholipase L1-like esterase